MEQGLKLNELSFDPKKIITSGTCQGYLKYFQAVGKLKIRDNSMHKQEFRCTCLSGMFQAPRKEYVHCYLCNKYHVILYNGQCFFISLPGNFISS